MRGTYESDIDHLPGTFGKANLATVLEKLVTNARRLSILRIFESQVGNIDRGLAGNDTALLLLRLALVTLDHVHALHDCAVLLRHDLENLATLALVFSGKQDDMIAFPCLLYTSDAADD